MNTRASRLALVIVAHGERGGSSDNRTVHAHAEVVRRRARIKHVGVGFLKAEPTLEHAIENAVIDGVDRVLVYPFLMSDGYFASRMLPKRLANLQTKTAVSVLPPLGLDKNIPGLLLEKSLLTAQTAGFDSRETRLLVVGHGSKIDPASARSTRDAAAHIDDVHRFRSVVTAFLEEPPFLQSELVAEPGPIVVAGFFSGEGLHAWVDIPAAIEETGVAAAYTGPIGASDGIPDVLLAAIGPWLSGACGLH